MIHSLPTCRLLCIDVPEVATGFKFFNDGEKPYVSFLNYTTNNVVSTGRVYHVPPGNWTLLGRFEDVTEETWKGIVETSYYDDIYADYQNYGDRFEAFATATASARSLIAGNPVVLIEKNKTIKI